MTEIIEIIIAPDGQSKLETKGFTGQSCREASRFLEEALGERTRETLTAEFHQTERQQQANRQRQ